MIRVGSRVRFKEGRESLLGLSNLVTNEWTVIAPDWNSTNHGYRLLKHEHSDRQVIAANNDIEVRS